MTDTQTSGYPTYQETFTFKVLKCGNPSCSSGNSVSNIAGPTTATQDSNGITYVYGWNGQVTFASDGNPVIIYDYAYVKWNQGQLLGQSYALYAAKCSNASCSSKTTVSIQSSTTAAFSVGGLAKKTNGYPTFIYTSSDQNTFVVDNIVVKCNNDSCSSRASADIGPDSSTYLFGAFALILDSSNNPIVGRSDQWNQSYGSSISVFHCTSDTCSSFDRNYTIASDTVVSTAGPGIAIGADGNPVISYATQSAGGGFNVGVNVVKCADPFCSGNRKKTFIDATSGQYISSPRGLPIGIGKDGKPVIVYSPDGSGLKVIKCGNEACSLANTLNTPDPASINNDADISFAVGQDGNPVIAYSAYINSAWTIRVAKCGNFSCSSGNATTTIATVSMIDASLDIAIGQDGNPIIAYASSSLSLPVTTYVKVAKCGNPSCSSGNIINTVGASTGSFDQASGLIKIAIGLDGKPRILYGDKIVVCGDASCSSGNQTFSLANVYGGDLAIAADNTLTIAYFGYCTSSYQYTCLTKCGDNLCSAGNTTVELPGGSNGSRGINLAIGNDGNPLVVWMDQLLSIIGLVVCADPACQK